MFVIDSTLGINVLTYRANKVQISLRDPMVKAICFILFILIVKIGHVNKSHTQILSPWGTRESYASQ